MMKTGNGREDTCVQRSCLPELFTSVETLYTSKPGTVNAGRKILQTKHHLEEARVCHSSEQTLSIYKHPCPPPTTRPEEQNAVIAFRRRMFSNKFYGSTSQREQDSLFNRGSALQGNRTSRERDNGKRSASVISVDHFTEGSMSEKLECLISEEHKSEDNQVEAADYDIEEDKLSQHRDRIALSVSDGKGRKMLAHYDYAMKRFTNRKQERPSTRLDPSLSITHHAFSEPLQFFQSNQRKKTTVNGPLEGFVQKLQTRNQQLSSKNLELTSKHTRNDDLDKTKEQMIKHWLCNVSMNSQSKEMAK